MRKCLGMIVLVLLLATPVMAARVMLAWYAGDPCGAWAYGCAGGQPIFINDITDLTIPGECSDARITITARRLTVTRIDTGESVLAFWGTRTKSVNVSTLSNTRLRFTARNNQTPQVDDVLVVCNDPSPYSAGVVVLGTPSRPTISGLLQQVGGLFDVARETLLLVAGVYMAHLIVAPISAFLRRLWS